MKHLTSLLAGLLLTLGVSAHASAAVIIASDGQTTVTVDTEKVCTNVEALKLLPKLNAILANAGIAPVPGNEVMEASVMSKGKMYGACAALSIPSVVAIMDDAGEENSLFPVPVSDFKVAPRI